MKKNNIPRNEYIRKPVGKTNPYKQDVIYDPMGQWKYPGQVTKIPSNQITMQGVNYPVYGEDNLGYGQMMYPGANYTFPGQYVTEIPMAQKGYNVIPNIEFKQGVGSQYDPVLETVIIDEDDFKNASLNDLLRHELWHHYQNYNNWSRLPEDFPTMKRPQTPSTDEVLNAYYNRRPSDMQKVYNQFRQYYPQFEFVPDDLVMNKYVEPAQYEEPWTEEGEARLAETNEGIYGLEALGYDTLDFAKNFFVPAANKVVSDVKNKKAYGGDPSLPDLTGHYQKGGRTPIYVTDPNDYRLRAYNDSLWLYQNNLKPLPKPRPINYSNKFEVKPKSILPYESQFFKSKKSDYPENVKKYSNKFPSNKSKAAYEDVEIWPKTNSPYKYDPIRGGGDIPNIPTWESRLDRYYPNFFDNPFGESIGFHKPWEDEKDDEYAYYTAARFDKPKQPYILKEAGKSKPVKSEVIKPSITKDKSGRPVRVIGQTIKDIPKTLPSKQSDKEQPKEKAEYMEMRQASMPITPQEEMTVKGKIKVPPTYIKQGFDPVTRKYYPYLVEDINAPAEQGRRIYNRDFPTSGRIPVPDYFVPQFEPTEDKPYNYWEADEKKKVVKKKQNGGWLDEYQKGGRAPIYVSDRNDPLLKAYQDSLNIHNLAKNAWHYGDTQVSKAEFDKKSQEESLWPQHVFAERKYKRDKKAGKVKNFEDYIITKNSKYFHSPEGQDLYVRDIFKPEEEGYGNMDKVFDEKLPSGKIRTYTGTYKGKIDKSNWVEFDPVTGTTASYSEPGYGEKNPVLLGIHNPYISPISHTYWAFKQKHPTNAINIKSLQERSVNDKPVFKSSSSKNYQNYTYGTTDVENYKAPVQPVVYLPSKYNANDPRIIAARKAFDQTFKKPLPNKTKKTVAPTKTQESLPEKEEKEMPMYMAMRQVSMPMLSPEELIIKGKIKGPQTFVKQKFDPVTRRYYPYLVEGWNTPAEQGQRIYNRDIPSGGFATPEGFVPQFKPREDKPYNYWETDNKKKVVKKKQNGGWLDSYQDKGEVREEPKLVQGYQLPEVNITDKQPGFLDRLTRRLQNTDFVKQLTNRIAESTGGKDWYKDPSKGFGSALAEVAMLPFATPQLAATYGVTGKVQTPSEAMKIQNPYAAFAVDAVLDPTNLVGAGIADDALKLSSKASKYLKNTAPQKLLSNKSGKFSKALEGTSSVFNELMGELTQGKVNRFSIKKGNKWLQDWINHPATQAKIDADINRHLSLFDPETLANNPEYKNYLETIREQSKNFKPGSKEYNLFTQFMDNLEQYVPFTKPQGPIHQGNWGVSYMHGYSPDYRQKVLTGEYKYPPKRYGSWISRSPQIDQTSRTSTTIHEGTHDWTSADALKTSGLRNVSLKNTNPQIKEDFLLWEKLRSEGKNPAEFMDPKKAYQAYLADPTEMHARIMELRNELWIQPDDVISPESAEKIIDYIEQGNSKISPMFLNVIDKDPKKLAELFNRFWGVVPAVTIGTGAAMQEKKTGGWLDNMD